MTPPNLIIRPLRLSDEKALNEICFKTFRDGNDRRFEVLAGLRWAVPYLRWETEHCFTAADEKDKPVGYILSALDSGAFIKAFHRRMRQEINRELNKQKSCFGFREFRKERFNKLHYFDYLPGWIRREFPAHLHMDVLPGFQGQGIGQNLMRKLLTHLKEQGCPGVHLGTGTNNEGALRFYSRAGFTLLHISQRKPVTFMGLKL